MHDHEVGGGHAWLAVREAEVALASGEPAAAPGAAERAISIASDLGRDDIDIVGRSLEGLALVHEGLVGEEMRRLDESAVAAKSGDVEDLMADHEHTVHRHVANILRKLGESTRAAAAARAARDGLV